MTEERKNYNSETRTVYINEDRDQDVEIALFKLLVIFESTMGDIATSLKGIDDSLKKISHPTYRQD